MNLGEKTFKAQTQGGSTRKVTAQVCDVSKPLMSVKKMVEAGNTVVFGPEGNYVYDGSNGEVMEMESKNGLFMLKAWVKAGGV